MKVHSAEHIPFYRLRGVRSRPRARGAFHAWEKERDFSGPVQVANSALHVPLAARSQVNKFGKHIDKDDEIFHFCLL